MKKTTVIIGFNIALLIVLLTALEIWARADYRHKYPGVKRPIQVLYPPNNINGFLDSEFKPNKPEKCFRILCLGGSTSQWANYPEFIAWAFRGQPYIRLNDLTVKVYSAGYEAHTTLDSYYKYRYLYKDYDFDLVIIYHGINDVRANSCPPGMFKADYSHYAYYSIINPAVKLMDIPLMNRSFLALKIVLTYEEQRRKRIEARNPDAFVPEEIPRPEWRQYGSEIKTAAPFGDNLQKIVDLAALRGQKTLLMTFAYCLPDSYTFEAFEKGELGYAQGVDPAQPVEIYGAAENVIKGLEAHNQVIRQVAESSNTYFIDQEKFLRGDMDSFIDVCHFSQSGISRFAGKIGNYFFKNRFTPAGKK